MLVLTQFHKMAVLHARGLECVCILLSTFLPRASRSTHDIVVVVGVVGVVVVVGGFWVV